MKTSYIDMDLLNHFKENWEKKKFGHHGQAILLAVSGGIDSMTLADLFKRSGIPFSIGHCNFQLRGEDSHLDEKFVEDWAIKNDVPFYITRFETEKVAADWKKGIQETARDLRYKSLEEIRSADQFHFIATAHNANDNAETLLINLFKGTGIAGLHGIMEKKNNLIRPLLFATRKEIEKYVSDYSIHFREDVSNASDKYLRNAVRLNILPVVEEHFPNVIDRLNETISRLHQTELHYIKEVERQINRLVQKRGADYYIPVNKLKTLDAPEAIFFELFTRYRFTPQQITQIIQLVNSGSGHFIESFSHKIIKDRDFLILTSKSSDETDFITVNSIPAIINCREQNLDFSFTDKFKDIPSQTNIAFIDSDKISFPLIIRRWKIGDYFYPLGMGMKKKKLSRFFIDQKIPINEKEKVWVIESNRRIVWVAGLRLDERFKITEATRKAITIRLTVGKKN
jgi:tRNA(Ile)-lysidine synthase